MEQVSCATVHGSWNLALERSLLIMLFYIYHDGVKMKFREGPIQSAWSRALGPIGRAHVVARRPSRASHVKRLQ